MTQATDMDRATKYPVQLVDFDDQPLYMGVIVPLSGTVRPQAVRVDGQIYVANGGIVGSGATGALHVYKRQALAVFVDGRLP